MSNRKDWAVILAEKLFPAMYEQTNHSGSFLSPAIRFEAKKKLEEYARIIRAAKPQ